MKMLRTNLYLKQSNLSADMIALLAGALLPLAFAPLNWWWLAWLCPGVLLAALQTASNKRALWRGVLFGLGYFGVGTSWVFISIHTFGQTNAILAVLLTVLFVSVLASFFMLLAWLYTRFFRASNPWLNALAFALLWTLMEVLRSWLFTGFPWLLLGNSQLSSPLKHFAPIVSVYGVSLFTALISTLLLNTITQARHLRINLAIILGIVLLATGLGLIRWTQPTHQPVSVALVQGDIAQSIKWDPAYLHHALHRYQQLTENNWQQWVVWPEGAVADTYQNQQSFLAKLATQAQQHHSWLTTGIAHIDQQPFAIYNSLMTFHGIEQQRYNKRHLVPFGEYLPFELLLRGVINFFNIPMSNFTSGAASQALLSVNGTQIAPFLCYEIAYPALVLKSLPEAQLLLTASDDTWFGKSWAAAQQLQISQMRSLEVGREQAVVGNDGLTALINAQGQVSKILPRGKVAVLIGKLQPRTGQTPLVLIGLKVQLLLIVLLLVMIRVIL